MRYATRHPFPIGYDEAVYVNQVRFDRDTLVAEGPLVFLRKQLGTERWRPPAYRMVAAPLALATNPTPPILRLLSLGSLFLAALLLYLAGREIAGTAGGIIWSAAFAMAVGPYRADLWFGTETPLYPALAGTVLAVARWYRRGDADRLTTVLLVAATALGALSKLSFLVVCVPFVLTAVGLAPPAERRSRSRAIVATAVVAGVVMVSPWWLFNWREAIDYASYASEFLRDSPPWFAGLVDDLLGWPFAVGVTAVAGIAIGKSTVIRRAPAGPDRRLLVVCLIGAVPLILLHGLGLNHNMRLLTPAWVLAAGALPLILKLTGLLARPSANAAVAAVILLQAMPLALSTWRRTEVQTDWNRLRELTRRRGFPAPRIVQLGYGPAFNPPQIMHAWMSRGEYVRARWIWRWEHGPLEWNDILRRIDSADVVLTRADTGGTETRNDNFHNQALARVLIAQGRWAADTLEFPASRAPTILVFTRMNRAAQ